MAQNDALFDRRTIVRNRRDALITDEQIKDHLKKLPDCTGKAETLGSEPLPAPGPRSRGKAP